MGLPHLGGRANPPASHLSGTNGEEARRPPYNIEAEQALLGGLLLNNGAIEAIPDLEPAHFFDEIHAEMFSAMQEASFAGRAFTPTTLAGRFRSLHIATDMDGAQYLGRLISNGVSGARYLKEYARTIIDAAQRRALIIIGEDLAARAYDPAEKASPADLIEDGERQLFQAALKDRSGSEVSFSDALKSALQAAEKARALNGEIDGVPTGFADIDAKLAGMGNGNLVVLGARPAMGKTALALNIGGNVARGDGKFDPNTGEIVASAGGHVHIFSQEMTATELAMRQLGDSAGISSDRIRRGDYKQAEFDRLREQVEQLSTLPITIEQLGGISLAQLAAKARRLKRKRDTKLIIVDYLQLMSAPQGRSGNRVGDITEITMGLKALAKELNVPVLALSQLSREVEKRADKRPQLADLRESGSIEQDADVVMFLYREDYYWQRDNPEPDKTNKLDHNAWLDDWRKIGGGTAEVIIAKQRHGATGTVKLAFEGSLTRFSNLARDEQFSGSNPL